MGRVKIFVDPGETIEEVEDSLLKAIAHHNSGDVHEGENFEDPAMNDVAEKMKAIHEASYQVMLQEIFALLEKDYTR